MSAAVAALPEQLTFDVGGELAKPTGASIAITGSGAIRSQLYIDATFDGTVRDVAFKKHDGTDTSSAWVERQHKIKLGDRVD